MGGGHGWAGGMMENWLGRWKAGGTGVLCDVCGPGAGVCLWTHVVCVDTGCQLSMLTQHQLAFIHGTKKADWPNVTGKMPLTFALGLCCPTRCSPHRASLLVRCVSAGSPWAWRCVAGSLDSQLGSQCFPGAPRAAVSRAAPRAGLSVSPLP